MTCGNCGVITVPCSGCRGAKCSFCHGTGSVNITCPRCGGSGKS